MEKESEIQLKPEEIVKQDKPVSLEEMPQEIAGSVKVKQEMAAAPSYSPRTWYEQEAYYNGKVYKNINNSWVQLGLGTPQHTLVTSGSYSASDTLALTSLAGNTAKMYRLVARISLGTATYLQLRFNNSSTAVYQYSVHYHGRDAAHSPVEVHSASTNRNQSEIILSYTNPVCKEFMITIDIACGSSSKAKLVNATGTCYNDDADWIGFETMGAWSNTSNELTEIDLTSVGQTLSVDYWLYKLLT